MIGVIAKHDETGAVCEFFELFKTPWEFFVPQHRYDIVIATAQEVPPNLKTTVLAIYNSAELEGDNAVGGVRRTGGKCAWLEWDGLEFPIYGDLLTFHDSVGAFVRRRGDGGAVGLTINGANPQIVRIGYDLFKEVSILLSEGQAPQNAHVPTLEIHISLLRKIMLEAGIPFIEVPPVPADYDFMVCLTHDVDFTGIREHKFDHTMFGFIYRACAGSFFRALRGKMAWSKCLQNLKAVLSLPLVYLGLRDDFWLEFDRYREIERGLGSTFFFIPFKNYPGAHDSGPAPKRRAVKYDVLEIREHVLALLEHGCEIGLHGIDAWQDSQKARDELNRIREVTGQSEVGVRMHWLYFSEGSPKALDEAGFSYDSTSGYNNAVGFRAGTTQVFRPVVSKGLLELSLNIQDTALFYPSRMNLSETEALDSCKQLVECASTFGGVLTLNWHTRSLSPERLWGEFYISLLKLIQNKRVWFATAEEIVSWFRKRRSLRFELAPIPEEDVRVRLMGAAVDRHPPFLVRCHRPGLSPVDSVFPGSVFAYSGNP